MGNSVSQDTKKRVLRNGKSGFLIVGLCVLACKLPLLLALIGFGGLSSAGALGFIPPELAGFSITVGVLGLMLLSGYFVFRKMKDAKS